MGAAAAAAPNMSCNRRNAAECSECTRCMLLLLTWTLRPPRAAVAALLNVQHLLPDIIASSNLLQQEQTPGQFPGQASCEGAALPAARPPAPTPTSFEAYLKGHGYVCGQLRVTPSDDGIICINKKYAQRHRTCTTTRVCLWLATSRVLRQPRRRKACSSGSPRSPPER